MHIASIPISLSREHHHRLKPAQQLNPAPSKSKEHHRSHPPHSLPTCLSERMGARERGSKLLSCAVCGWKQWTPFATLALPIPAIPQFAPTRDPEMYLKRRNEKNMSEACTAYREGVELTVIGGRDPPRHRRSRASPLRQWHAPRCVPLSLSGVKSPTHSSVTVSLNLRRARRTSTAPSVACSSLRLKPGEQLLCCSHALHSWHSPLCGCHSCHSDGLALTGPQSLVLRLV